METVLIVSVLKYSANNNKTFLLKNTAIETKHRTFRELYNEAIERCGVPQCHEFKSIFISKTNIIDDTSIEISDENMVVSLCVDLNFKFVQFALSEDGHRRDVTVLNFICHGLFQWKI